MKSPVLDVMLEQFSPKKGWRAKAPSKREALRKLLSDRELHSQHELAQVAGYRYSARLFELHQQKDAVHYTRKADAQDDSIVWYRQAKQSNCTQCKANKGR